MAMNARGGRRAKEVGGGPSCSASGLPGVERTGAEALAASGADFAWSSRRGHGPDLPNPNDDR